MCVCVCVCVCVMTDETYLYQLNYNLIIRLITQSFHEKCA